MDQGQGTLQGPVGQVYQTLECDFAEIEKRTVAVAGVPLEYLRGQAKCGECETRHYGGHSIHYCATRVTMNACAQRGYVPVKAVLAKVLKAAGVPIVLAPFSNNPNLKAPIKRGYPRLPRSGYAPFWAEVLWQYRDFGNRTSLKDQEVRRFIRMLREVDGDPKQQMELVLEELLVNGKWSIAAKNYQRIYGGLSKNMMDAVRRKHLEIMENEARRKYPRSTREEV